MKKRNAALLFCFALTFAGCVFVGCAKRIPALCSPTAPGVEKMTIQFVCPYVGASYPVEVFKCPGDKHFRVDIVCKLCGRRHHQTIQLESRISDIIFCGDA